MEEIVVSKAGKSDHLVVAPYYGGKGRLAHILFDYYPKHKNRVYVFGGLAGDLLNQPPPDGYEIFNDLNYNIFSLFKLLRNKRELSSLFYFLDNRLHCRKTWEEAKEKLLDENLDFLERGKQFYYFLRHSFSGNLDNPPFKKPASKSSPNTIIIPIKEKENILQINKRLRMRTTIEHQDFSKIIPRFDSKDALFVCDPPYTGQEENYLTKFPIEDHDKLFSILNNIEGKFILTYKLDKYIDKLYSKEGWTKVKIKNQSSANSKKKEYYYEMVYMNYKYKIDKLEMVNEIREWI